MSVLESGIFKQKRSSWLTSSCVCVFLCVCKDMNNLKVGITVGITVLGDFASTRPGVQRGTFTEVHTPFVNKIKLY